MEHVTIKYPESRIALIDGEEAGMTNTVLRVEYQELLKDLR